jgi:hypothetical protein
LKRRENKANKKTQSVEKEKREIVREKEKKTEKRD